MFDPLFFMSILLCLIGLATCFIFRWNRIVQILIFPLSIALAVFGIHIQFVSGGGEGGIFSLLWSLGAFVLALVVGIFTPSDES